MKPGKSAVWLPWVTVPDGANGAGCRRRIFQNSRRASGGAGLALRRLAGSSRDPCVCGAAWDSARRTPVGGHRGFVRMP